MLIDIPQYPDAYNILKRSATTEEGCSVLVLCSCDLDSLCSLFILSELLKDDLISYKIHPVSCYEDMLEADVLIKEDSDMKSLIFLNCGGCINLRTFFTNLSEHITLFVFDSHKPYHLSNISDQQQVVIFDDGKTKGDPVYQKLILDDGYQSKRRKTEQQHDDQDLQRENKAQRKELKHKYYASSHYGDTVANLLYCLAKDLGKESKDFLWMSILALTDHFLQRRIDDKAYLSGFQVLFEDLGNTTDAAVQTDPSSTIQKFPKMISYIDDFIFMLLRHWNLYESMFHSRFFATKFGIWRRNGTRRLETLLAKMGIPLEQSKQKYSCMNIELKRQLRSKLEHCSKEYGLKQVCFMSFQRVFGTKTVITASDCVYAINSLLETPSSGDLGLDLPPPSENDCKNSFFHAYQTLTDDNVGALLRGFDLAIFLQQAIVKQGVSMVNKRVITLSGPFRYSIISDAPDISLFYHPVALSKLACFIMDIMEETKKIQKPFVLCVLNENKKTYLVVCRIHDNKPNIFGTSIRKAAKKTNATIMKHSFDSSVVEILKDDLAKFIEYLHSSMVTSSL